jgi:hypothetical protein
MADYTTIDQPTDHFNVVDYTGNASSGNAVTGVGHQPDTMWSKRWDGGWGWQMFDTNRGGTKRQKIIHLGSYLEDTGANYVTSWDSDGFTLGSDGQLNTNGGNYHAFCWKANGGTTSSNTSGDITTTVQNNSIGKFSIFSYTGNSSGSGQTIGHGLGVKPDFVQIINTDTHKYQAYHRAYNPAVTTAGISETVGWQWAYGTPYPPATWWNAWDDTAMTSSLITLHSDLNANGDEFIGYARAEVQGYSKFGHFQGNGSTDGPYIVTGFKPKYMWTRNVDRNNNTAMYISHDVSSLSGIDKTYETNPFTTGENWDGVNNANYDQWLGTGGSSPTGVSPVDFYSNGFKILGADGNVAFGPSGYGINPNDDGEDYIYAAWAENPFVTSGGVPATGR